MDASLIDPKYEPMLRAAVITLLVFGFYALFRPSSRFSTDALDKRVYRPSIYAKFIGYTGYLVVGFFVYLPFSFPKTESADFLLFGSIALIFGVITQISINKLKTSFIEVLDDELHTKYGRKENRIPYNQIIDAYCHYGYLHVVLLEKNRHGMHKEKRIPAIFANQGALLENIRQRAIGAAVHILR
jgi:hypothetical protein